MNKILVVEGRDDLRAVREAYPDAGVICTHGFGISAETWKRIETACNGPGIIILTDPDFAGENIRKRIAERFPGALHAFLPREEGTKDGDVGIENASAASIREAVENAKVSMEVSMLSAGTVPGGNVSMGTVPSDNREGAHASGKQEPFTERDLDRFGLAGGEGASERRARLGKALGIGYGNSKAFLNRLNTFAIERKEFEKRAEEVFTENKTR